VRGQEGELLAGQRHRAADGARAGREQFGQPRGQPLSARQRGASG
jgi:hypothetical protein